MRNAFKTYLAPAKLNLGLKIVGKRKDGYHLLKTIFCLINVFDEIDIQTTLNGKISLIEHNQAWNYKLDLTFRAAAYLQEYAKNIGVDTQQMGANIKIRKVIPSGGGMGGGSSDAATVLNALNSLWGLYLSSDVLSQIGLTLGADVPFFIYNKHAFATGIGEVLKDITLPHMYFVIIIPHFPIPTKNIFNNLTIEHINNNCDKEITEEYLINTHENDLLSIATKLYPQLQSIISDIAKYGYGAPHMTGSGSVLYLNFNNKESAYGAYMQIKDKYNVLLTDNFHA